MENQLLEYLIKQKLIQSIYKYHREIVKHLTDTKIDLAHISNVFITSYFFPSFPF